MKRMTCFVMALALVLGLAQCKKEQLKPENEGERVTITLDVKGDDNAKVNVNPPDVTFERGDKIQVACNGHHVGTLTHNGTKFKGDLENVTVGQPLYFYFFGNVTPQYFGGSQNTCTVYIGEQTGDLPVIAMGPSIDLETGEIVYYTSGVKSYSARLHNKCSLMKFDVTTASTAPIFIKGMNNFVEVNFATPNGADNGFSYNQKYDGLIKMKGQEGSGQKTYWAIVLPQDYVAEGSAYTENGYIGTRPAIGRIGSNQYYSTGVDMALNPSLFASTPLTFEAKTAGATVTLSKAGTQSEQAPSVSLEININDGGWSTYTVGTTITLSNVGDKVMFRGTNTRFAKSTSAYHKFSLGDDCYVYGNIMSLIDADNYVAHENLDSQETGYYTFCYLFEECNRLYNHPDKTLLLPALGLTSYCYSYMFKGCTHLTVAPDLPADALKEGCYKGMFEDCTSLTASPVLWAGELLSNCYSSMFSGCSSLSHVTCLAIEGYISPGSQSPNTTNWLNGVASSGMLYVASGVNFWPTESPNGIPSGWSVEVSGE